jgi:hypothetical protein
MAIPNGTDLAAFEVPLREHLRQLGDPLRIATESRAKAIGDWHSKITGFLGESFEIAVVVEQLRDAITEANQAGVYALREIEATTLKSKLNELKNLKIKENLTLARVAADATELSVSINNIAQFDRKVEFTLLGTLEQCDEFLTRTSTMIATKLSSMPPSPADQGNRLARKVCEIEGAWNSLEAII